MKGKALALIGALGTFGAMAASAATLGGLGSSSVGADQTVIASCDTDGIALAYTNSYDPTTNTYRTGAVTLSGVNSACTGKAFKLTLSDGTTSLGETSGTVTLVGGSQVVTLSSPVDTKSVAKASLVITG